MSDFFNTLQKENQFGYHELETTNLSLVALALDSTARRLHDLHKASGSHHHDFAVIKLATGDEPHTKVLYTITAPTKHLAFYIMCLDACVHKSEKDESPEQDDVCVLDPEYRTLDVVTLLKDVGERASWRVGDLWKSFVQFFDSGEIHPYTIVEATRDHVAGFDAFFKEKREKFKFSNCS